MSRMHWLAIIALALPIFSPLQAQEKPLRTPENRVFRAGAHAQDITPAIGVSLNGGMADRKATAVYDPLHARCVVLDDGANQLVIVVCDACMIPRDIFDAAKEIIREKTGIPAANMLMSATHTHSAPTSTGVFQSDPDEQYRKALPGKIAAGVIKAHANLEPARVGWAVGSDPTQVYNRRWLTREGVTLPDPFGVVRDRIKMNPGIGNPQVQRSTGVIDPQITLLSAIAKSDGRPIALIANYSLHYVGGQPGDQVSADYFAQFAKRVGEMMEEEETQRRSEEETKGRSDEGTKGRGGEGTKAPSGSPQSPSNPKSEIPNPKSPPPFLALMSNGTSGDVNNVNFARKSNAPRKSGEQIVIVADSVAHAAMKAYRAIQYHDWVALKSAEAEIDLRVRKPTDKDIAQAKQWLEDARAQGPVLKSLPHIYARETVLLAEYPDAVKVKLQAHRVGELGLCAIPCEVFAEIGLSLKKQSPLKPTAVFSLANGYNGYLPTPAQHELGGYETWRARSSYLEVNASVKIEKTLMELLEKVK